MEKEKIKKKVGIDELNVRVEGIVPIMFDRYISQDGEFPPEQKLYLDESGGLVFPAKNVHSFFFAQEKSCAAKFMGKKRFDYCQDGLAYVTIDPFYIPICKNAGQVIFNGFDENEKDEANDIWVDRSKALVKKGRTSIPHECVRPVLDPPWRMDFTITIVKNNRINSSLMINWLMQGGLEIGFGTFRPMFGRFILSE